MSLVELPKHEATCLITKCWNFDNCQKPQNATIKALKPCCSELCDFVLKMQEKFGDKKAMYELLGKYFQNMPVSNVVKADNKGGSNRNIGNVGNVGGGSISVAWDPARTGGSIQLT